MPTPSKQKPYYPPLKCEQLEDRSVLTVHTGATATIAAETSHTNASAPVATNHAFVSPMLVHIVSPGAVISAPVDGSTGSSTSSATSATGASGASSGSAASSATNASSNPGATQGSGSSSGAASGGGPLFTSGGTPLILFAGRATIPQSPSASEGASPSTISSLAGSVGSPSTFTPAAVTDPTSVVATPMAQVDVSPVPVLEGTTTTQFLAPLPAEAVAASSSTSLNSMDQTPSLPASTLPPLSGPTATTTSSSETQDTAAPVIQISSDSPEATGDESLAAITDVPLN